MTATHLQAEFTSQPQAWRDVLARLDELAPFLPQPGQRASIVGCGTSYHVALAYAAYRESAGHGVTDAWPASEYLPRDEDRVVLVSRSGTTTEVADLAVSLVQRQVPTTAMLGVLDTPVGRSGVDVLDLTAVDEQSVVQTRFATTALTLLLASAGADRTAAIEQAQAILDEDETSALGAVLDAEQVSFVGSGWAYGVAQEAALKLRESVGAWAEAYHGMEYRHGPISIAAPGRVVWALGPVPDGLADQARATGAHLEYREGIDPLAELVRVHRLCLARAERLGLDPDQPRNLTRSVILR